MCLNFSDNVKFTSLDLKFEKTEVDGRVQTVIMCRQYEKFFFIMKF